MKKNLKITLNLYSICQFDLNFTQLGEGSTIDCENNSNNNNVQGGQHCFRLYYKNPCGKKPKHVNTYQHKTSWGIKTIRECACIICNGKSEYDNSMLYLYSLCENEI